MSEDNTYTKIIPPSVASDTDNATEIHPSDAPTHKRAKFRRFREWNRGLWNGPKREETQKRRRQDDLHRIDAITSTLGLTKSQSRRARRKLDSLDLGEFNRYSESVDDVSFAVCVIVANEDVSDGVRYWPYSNDNDEEFEHFASELGLDESDQMSVIERVRTRL